MRGNESAVLQRGANGGFYIRGKRAMRCGRVWKVSIDCPEIEQITRSTVFKELPADVLRAITSKVVPAENWYEVVIWERARC